jgi:hypothetical protein
MLLPTGSGCAVDDRQQDGRIGGGGGVVYLCASIVVKLKDCQVSKVTPSMTEVAVPIAKDAVNNGAQIQLGTKNVKHHAAVNAWHGKNGLVHLKCMCAFRGLHGQIDDRVELDGDLVYLNQLEGPWDKHVVCHCGSFFWWTWGQQKATVVYERATGVRRVHRQLVARVGTGQR